MRRVKQEFRILDLKSAAGSFLETMFFELSVSSYQSSVGRGSENILVKLGIKLHFRND